MPPAGNATKLFGVSTKSHGRSQPGLPGPFEFGINAGYDLCRSGDDLTGFRDVDFGVTVCAKATLNFGPADFLVSVDKTPGGSDGLLGSVGVEVTQPVTEQFVLGVQVFAAFADENRMAAYLGIDGEQAGRSGYIR
jgi:outer membrane scaffolding protein for murein synthesis (MipA/OmpV family)